MNPRGLTIRWAGAMLGAFLLLGFGSASAQTTDCDSGPFIALNLADRDGETANKAIAFPGDTSELRNRLELYARPAPPPASEDASLFKAFALQLTEGNTRWITKKGTRIAIYVIYDTSKEKEPTLKITEKERKTRLATDFETLAKLVQKIGGVNLAAAAALGDSTFAVLKQCRTLTQVRANLEVTATAGGPVNGQANNPAGSSTPAEATITVTTGPTEHAFLSADLAVNNVKELKIDSGELVSKDNPSTFYVGFDYMVGDVLAESNTPLQGLTFKALVQASKKPLDSLGIALGMRLKLINAPFGFQLDTLSPWVGYIWNRNDTMTGTRTGHEYKGDWRVGISLNLDKALGWVQ